MGFGFEFEFVFVIFTGRGDEEEFVVFTGDERI